MAACARSAADTGVRSACARGTRRFAYDAAIGAAWRNVGCATFRAAHGAARCGAWRRPRLRFLALLAAGAGVVRCADVGSIVVGTTTGEDLGGPAGLMLMPNGDLMIADTQQDRALLCPAPLPGYGTCVIIAGASGGGAAAFQLNSPYAISGPAAGDPVFVADTLNNRVQRWDNGYPSGTTVVLGEKRDGLNISLINPVDVFFDETNGKLYVSDSGNHRVVTFPVTNQRYIDEDKVRTVAGTKGVSGRNMEELNNPTAIFVETTNEIVWVCDALNKRVMRWEKDASEGVIEVKGLYGRPYGVTVSDGAIYWADADECVVRKRKLNGEQIGAASVVVVGSSKDCGNARSQLSFPMQIVVTDDGTVFVADNRNNRIVKWTPQPSSTAAKCTFGEECGFKLSGGNPMESSLVALIDSSSSCGKETCELGDLGGANFTRIASPNLTYDRETDRLRSALELGSLWSGTRGVYKLCWGPAPILSAIQSGDCSTMPYMVGTLEIRAKFIIDNDAETLRCVRAALCQVRAAGYGSNYLAYAYVFRAKVTEVPTFYCGYKDPFFVGWSSMDGPVLENRVKAVQPLVAPNPSNLTVTTDFPFGMAVGLGRYPLCVCLLLSGISDCTHPIMFNYGAGAIQVRGVEEGQTFICDEGQDCTLELEGSYLQETDNIWITGITAECANPFKILQYEYVLPFQNSSGQIKAIHIALNVTAPEADGPNMATFKPGLALAQGRFKICYCPTHETPTPDGEQVGPSGPCAEYQDFVQDAGILEVRRAYAATTPYECAWGQECGFDVRGHKLNVSDRIIIEAVGQSECGDIGPASNIMEVNAYYAVATQARPWGSPRKQSFTQDLSSDVIPGKMLLCYCASYDEDGGLGGPCDIASEFFTQVGFLAVRGPLPALWSCTAEAVCMLTVLGTRLQESDRLQVVPGSYSECPLVDLPDGVVYTGPDPDGPGVTKNPMKINDMQVSLRYKLGPDVNFPHGTYTVCYCASISFSDKNPCTYADEYTMKAGLLVLRGPNKGGRFKCVSTARCEFTVQGFELQSSDAVLITSMENACGTGEPLAGGELEPSAVTQATAGRGSTTEQVFEFAKAHLIDDGSAEAGHYRVCFCSFPKCDRSDPSYFHLDAGILTLTGVVIGESAEFCAIRSRCSFQVDGKGLLVDGDAVMLIPWAFKTCGGAQVIVNTNKANSMDVVYSRLPAYVNGKPSYSAGASSYLYYNQFYSTWIFGPELGADVPEPAGKEWVKVRSEESVPENIHETWLQYSYLAKAWEGMAINLSVRSSAELGLTNTTNPVHILTSKVVDPVLGSPYLIEETFDLGAARKIGVYRTCFCGSTDLFDLDTIPCTSEVEYGVDLGALVVHVVQTLERYHCIPSFVCNVKTLLPGYDGTVVEVALLPADGSVQECHLMKVFPEESGFSNSVGGRTVASVVDGVATFSFGSTEASGTYKVCVCTQYQIASHLGGGDAPCSQPEEFFQTAGSLVVAEVSNVYMESGSASIMKIERGSGLSPLDEVRLVKGERCFSNYAYPPYARDLVFLGMAEKGGWSEWQLPDDVDGGNYRACLCTAQNGIAGDGGTSPCKDVEDYYMEVAWVIASAVEADVEMQTVSSVLELSIEVSSDKESDATSIATDPVVANILADAVKRGLSDIMGLSTAEQSKMSVAIDDLRFVETDATGDEVRRLSKVVPMMADFTATLKMPVADVSLESVVGAGDLTRDTIGSYLSQAEWSVVPAVVSATVQEVAAPTNVAITQVWPDYICVKGQQCDVVIAGRSQLQGGNKLLVLNGADGVCGWPSETMVSNMSAAGFLPSFNPTTGPVENSTTQPFNLGRPTAVGTFTLCFCLLLSSVGSCNQSGDYFQRAGTLKIIGVVDGAVATCRVHWDCDLEINGFGLTVFDKMMLVNGDCGSSAPAITTFSITLASTRLDSIRSNEIQTFSFGVPSKVGVYHACYCNFAASSTTGVAPCAISADFISDFGVVAVRGTSLGSKNDYRCPLTMDDIVIPWGFDVPGEGLWPQADAVMLTEIVPGQPCGNATQVGFSEIVPNPARITAAAEAIAWPADGGQLRTSIGRVTLDQCLTPKIYQLCWCTAATIQGCRGQAAFSHFIGTVTAAGATPGQAFTCFDGERCSFTILGNALSSVDSLVVVGASSKCSDVVPTRDLLKHNPLKPVFVADDGLSAHFDLGWLTPDSRQLPLSFRLCYCASYDRDLDGAYCNRNSEYTHSAGYLNTVICRQPAELEDTFTPLVEDVFGDAGDPRVSFYYVPSDACLAIEASAGSATKAAAGFSAFIPASGRLQGNFSGVLTTKDGSCEHHGVGVILPSCNMISVAMVDLEVIDLDHRDINNRYDNAFDENGGRSGPAAVRLWLRRAVRAQTSLNDTSMLRFTCPPWEIKIVPYACTAWFTVWMGFLCHVVLALASFFSAVTPWLKALYTFVTKKCHCNPSAVVACVRAESSDPPETMEFMDGVASAMCQGNVLFIMAGVRILMVLPCALLAVLYALDGALPLWYQVAGNGFGFLASMLAQICIVKYVCKKRLSFVHFWRTLGAALKLHLDVFLPALARYHHCEFWRVAAIAAIVNVVLIQTLWPACNLLSSLRAQRRRVPDRAARWTFRAVGPLKAIRNLASSMPLPMVEGGACMVVDRSQESAASVYPALELQESGRGGWWALFRRDVILAMASLFMMCTPRQSAPPEEQRRMRLLATVGFLEAAGWHLPSAALRSAAESVTGVDVDESELRWIAMRLFWGGCDLTAFHALLLIAYKGRLNGMEVLALVGGFVFGVVQPSSPHLRRSVSDYLLQFGRMKAVIIFVVYTILRFWAMTPLFSVSGNCPWFPWPIAFWIAVVFVFWLPALVAAERRQARQEERRLAEGRSDKSLYSLQESERERELQQGGKSPAAKSPASTQEKWRVTGTPSGASTSSRPGSRSWRQRIQGQSFRSDPLSTIQRGDVGWKRSLSLLHNEPLMESSVRLVNATATALTKMRLRAVESSISESGLGALQKLDEAAFDDVLTLGSRLEKLLVDLAYVHDVAARTKSFTEACRLIHEALTRLETKEKPGLDNNRKVRERDELGKAWGELLVESEAELQWARLAESTVTLASSRPFHLASQLDRVRLMGDAFPDLPAFTLVHWQDLETFGTLPHYSQNERVSKAGGVFKEHGQNAIFVAVVHYWRSANQPDPRGVTAKQLLSFARCYRSRWGEHLEPYFWIDYSSLPRLQQQTRRSAARVDPRLDAMLPLVYAASDAVVVCETKEMEHRAWIRTELGIAHAFSPAGRLVYILGRSLAYAVGLDDDEIALPVSPSFRRTGTWRTSLSPPSTGRSMIAYPIVSPNNGDAGAGFDPFGRPSVRSSTRLASPFPGEPTSPMSVTQETWRTVGTTSSGIIFEQGVGREMTEGAIAVESRKWTLLHPLHPDAELRLKLEDQPRLARLVHLCLSRSAAVLSGDAHRPTLVFGSTQAHFRRLTVDSKKVKAAPTSPSSTLTPGSRRSNHAAKVNLNMASVHFNGEEDDEGESDDGGPDKLPILEVDLGCKMVSRPADRGEQAWEDRVLQDYYSRKEEVKIKPGKIKRSRVAPAPEAVQTPAAVADLGPLRQAALAVTDADDDGACEAVAPVMPLEPWPRTAKFHGRYLSGALRLQHNGRVLELAHGASSTLAQHRGGVACTAEPLRLFRGAAPSQPTVVGIAFEVEIADVDDASTTGLAIGFTAQNPDDMPAGEVAAARASHVPRSWVCGYSGSWFFQRRNSPLGGGKVWVPVSLRVGDVVTAVAVSSPIGLIRILVNGELVAEELLRRAQFPDLIDTPIWGIVDVTGSCRSVILTEPPPDRAGNPAQRVAELRAETADHRGFTGLGSTGSMGSDLSVTGKAWWEAQTNQQEADVGAFQLGHALPEGERGPVRPRPISLDTV